MAAALWQAVQRTEAASLGGLGKASRRWASAVLASRIVVHTHTASKLPVQFPVQ